jgi:hypothetical protein
MTRLNSRAAHRNSRPETRFALAAPYRDETAKGWGTRPSSLCRSCGHGGDRAEVDGSAEGTVRCGAPTPENPEWGTGWRPATSRA